VIIALGESIVAIGVGAQGMAIGAGVFVAAVVGIALAAALWWAYFDLSRLSAERRLTAARGEERARLARDSYSYLHLPMVAGIIFAALGIEQTLAHTGDPLGTIPAVALCGGIALYLLGHNAFRLREEGNVSVPRLVVTILCLVLIGVAVSVPSLVTLSVLTLLLCGLATRRRPHASFGASSVRDRRRGTQLIHRSAWKVNSPKIISTNLHNTILVRAENDLFSALWLIAWHKILGR
jgi:low temperature requirement protein LtrA